MKECVCVCGCERERERGAEGLIQFIYFYFAIRCTMRRHCCFHLLLSRLTYWQIDGIPGNRALISFHLLMHVIETVGREKMHYTI